MKDSEIYRLESGYIKVVEVILNIIQETLPVWMFVVCVCSFKRYVMWVIQLDGEQEDPKIDDGRSAKK